VKTHSRYTMRCRRKSSEAILQGFGIGARMEFHRNSNTWISSVAFSGRMRTKVECGMELISRICKGLQLLAEAGSRMEMERLLPQWYWVLFVHVGGERRGLMSLRISERDLLIQRWSCFYSIRTFFLRERERRWWKLSQIPGISLQHRHSSHLPMLKKSIIIIQRPSAELLSIQATRLSIAIHLHIPILFHLPFELKLEGPREREAHLKFYISVIIR